MKSLIAALLMLGATQASQKQTVEHPCYSWAEPGEWETECHPAPKPVQEPPTPQQKISSLKVAEVAKEYCVGLEHLTGSERDKCELAVAIGFIAGEEYGRKPPAENIDHLQFWPINSDNVITCSHWMVADKNGQFRCD
jgi:hypothetical protein